MSTGNTPLDVVAVELEDSLPIAKDANNGRQSSLTQKKGCFLEILAEILFKPQRMAPELLERIIGKGKLKRSTLDYLCPAEYEKQRVILCT